MDVKLITKQKLFCDEYLIDLNATRAYKAAGYSIKSDNAAAVEGHKLLRNPKIDLYLKQRMEDREKRTEITQDMVLKELAKIGFANATDFARVVEKSYMKPILDAEGNKTGEEEAFYKTVEIFATKEISQDKLGAIASIKQGPNGIEVKPNDKVKALELIGRHLGMFTDKVDVKVEKSEKLADIIDQLGGEGLDEEE
ncbi:terminase small subunit [Alkaliphilus sp. MSJ-5]|uniref:Terminase small subunit n=1 Tax=Alkaliphilus flagellatus TaxID=2841507 RepID=A0ABS6G6I1_9FIRM|nr:terminase small subunit [Alkaliphilus flagellatus]MBU5677764.1 terminase small subunit [Alkaliphilus flagellatus]